MRYCESDRRISVSVVELVRISRRGISGTYNPAYDDEPSMEAPSRRLASAMLSGERASLTYSFEGLGYAFDLTTDIEAVSGDEITTLATAERSAEKPRREEIEIARGEAFLSAFIYAKINALSEVGINIIYISDKTGELSRKSERVRLGTLEKFFDRSVAVLAKYARPEIERVTVRLPSMRDMRFPFKKVRDGQSELVRAGYRALKKGISLYASAPTGTGKTVSVLYPAIKLVGEGRHSKVFYLTPKTTATEVAADCIDLLASEGAKIRAVILTSKEKSCPEGMVCRRAAPLCHLSDMSHLADAALALYDLGLTVTRLKDARGIAEKFSVCPYELMLTYSELCDAVICDINYLFDPRVYLRRYFDIGGDYALLVDEAHNLAERARDMYSADFGIEAMRERLESPLIGKMSKLAESYPAILDKIKAELYALLRDEVHRDKDGKAIGATHATEIPAPIYSDIDELLSLLDDELHLSYRAKDEAAAERTEYLRSLYYDIKRVSHSMELFDECFRLFVFQGGEEIRMKLFALDPGRIVRSMTEKGRGAIFFSATLSPMDYYKSLLGADGSSEVLEAMSPFAPESLSVSIMDKISTRYSERERTLPAVARAIAATMNPRRGNYMVFAPSFEYLTALAECFRTKYPKIKVIAQERDMTQREKAAFLSEFESTRDEYLVGFAVMGGIYSEGIDLVGDKLIGAVVVGIGMPSLSYEREAMAEYYEERYEEGKQYAYIYPGMNRVLQAAGRVIRHELDRGVIVLIDDRFDDPIYKKIIPSLWAGMEYVGDPKELNERIKEFWRGIDEEK